MKIERYAHGWRIEPSTNNEETALKFLLEALKDKYIVPIEVSSSQLTNHSLPLIQIQHRVDSK